MQIRYGVERMCRVIVVLAVVVSGVAAVASGQGRTTLLSETGRLGQGDSTLNSGEFFKRHTFEVAAGQSIQVVMTSNDFDTYLILLSPSGQRWENDDWDNRQDMSRIDATTDQAGQWMVMATSYEEGETGQYALQIEQAEATALQPAVVSQGQPLLDATGRLEPGDQTLNSGEFVDRHTFEVEAGQSIRVAMTSSDFDTYLILLSPSGQRWENDDWDDRQDLSRIEVMADQTGQWTVMATSYEEGETGQYALRVDREANPVNRVERQTTLLNETGRLEPGDQTLSSGEFVDRYTFQAEAGQTLRVVMTSGDFDTFLILRSPSGGQSLNDDWQNRQDMSRIDLVAQESGQWTVLATSYRAGMTGAYTLRVEQHGQDDAAPSVPPVARRRIHAVFVGISDYENATIPRSSLPDTAQDARRLYEAMVSSVGMQAADCTLLVEADATVSAVRGAIQRTLEQMDPNDLFVFFFSGHGDRVRIVLQPNEVYPSTDANGHYENISLWDGELLDHELSEILDQAPYDTNMLIAIDACFAGGFSKNVINRPGRVGLFSSPDYMTSVVAGRFQAGGYLSAFIIEAVKYRRADTNGDKVITADEIVAYISASYGDHVKTVLAGEANPNEGYVSPDSNRRRYQRLVSEITVPPHHVLFGW